MKSFEIIKTGFVPNSQIEFSMANLTVSYGEDIALYLPVSIGSLDQFDLLRFRRGIKNTGDEQLEIVVNDFWNFVIRNQDGIEMKRFSQDAILPKFLEPGQTADIAPTDIEQGQFIRLDDMPHGFYSLGIMANPGRRSDADPFITATEEVLFEYALNGVRVVTAFPPYLPPTDVLAMGKRIVSLEQQVDELLKGKVNPN